MRWAALLVATTTCALSATAGRLPIGQHGAESVVSKRSLGHASDRMATVRSTSTSSSSDSLDLPTFQPQVREYTLELSNRWLAPDGFWRQTFAINGQTPGPAIEGNEGDTFRIKIVNNLGIQTTMHWHGLEVPMVQDGTYIQFRSLQPSNDVND